MEWVKIMTNSVERLFDQVLPQLDATSSEKIADWPDSPIEEDDYDLLDRPPETNPDQLSPIRDLTTADRAADVLLGGRSSSPGLPETDRELIEGGIRACGIEALAFYKSMRFKGKEPFPGRWGIFYLRQGLTQIEWEIATAYPGYKDPRKLAHQFLFAHEHFHFRADLQVLMFEALRNTHLYNPLRRALRGRRSQFVEEALANRQAYDWAKKDSIGLREFAFDFMSLQPNAYARFYEPQIELAGEWAANVLDLQPPGCKPRVDVASWVDATPKDFLRKSLCPQYVIFPRKLENWINPAWVPPPVKKIVDGDALKKLLSSKYATLSLKWEETKRKLLENRTLRGLNFKPWPKEGKDIYSVRVDDKFRAHLQHQGQGMWLAYILGPHKKMGHG